MPDFGNLTGENYKAASEIARAAKGFRGVQEALRGQLYDAAHERGEVAGRSVV